MKSLKICICYGTNCGATEKTAKLISEEFLRRTVDIEIDTFNLSEDGPPYWKNYNFLVLGSPTYYNGHLQDDWSDTVLTTPPNELQNKSVALFGLGDQESFSFTFVDGLGHLANWLLKECHANLTGYWPVQNCRSANRLTTEQASDSNFKTPHSLTNYNFEKSAALTTHCNQPVFYGLALDQYSQNELTVDRISCWCQSLIDDWGLNTYNEFTSAHILSLTNFKHPNALSR